MVATYPVGGVAWDYLQYAIGLERLGWDVYYLEDTAWETYDPNKGQFGEDPSFGVEFLRRTLAEFSPSMAERWHMLAMDGTAYGLAREKLLEVVRSADLFLNVSGGTLLRDEYLACTRKILIDTDPGYNHFVNFPKWDRNPGWYGSHGYRAHDVFFTYAERTGQPDCSLPSMGIEWHATRPLVVVDAWSPEAPATSWTTVLTWNNYGKPVEHEGRRYGSKELEFPMIEGVPQAMSGERFEIAAGGSPPAERWRKHGWNVIDSHTISRTSSDYRHYVQQSRGEFSVAKNVYVATGSGWFSCRSVCYLAAGRPVVVQDTGFSRVIPTGAGVLRFSNREEAIDAVRSVESDYAHHSKYAREIAAEYFGSEPVLRALLRQAGLA